MLPRVNIVRTESIDYMLFSGVDAISQTIQAQGSWAPLLTEIAHMFCSEIANPLVLDIGANLGAFSIPLAQKLAANGGSVYSYEPQRIVYYQLCGNIFLNRLDNIHAFNYAIGDQSQEIRIPELNYDNCPNVGGFTLSDVAARVFQIESTNGSNSVMMRSLDDLELPKNPDLIKIDVEGFEMQVLEGSANLLKKSLFPPMLIEAHTQYYVEQRAAILNWLDDHGYRVFSVADEVFAQHESHPRQFLFGTDKDTNLTMTRVR